MHNAAVAVANVINRPFLVVVSIPLAGVNVASCVSLKNQLGKILDDSVVIIFHLFE